VQVIVGIGAKPVVSPFEAVGVSAEVGGIEVCFHAKVN
jgi:monodehydroascorbate reductase (NADH)